MISLIDAGPGTGKTFSLVYGYLHLKKQLFGSIEPTQEQKDIFQYITSEFSKTDTVVFLTHSNTVKDTLIKRLGKSGPKVYTFHGAGLSNIIKKHGYQKPVSNRTESHIQILSGMSLRDMPYKEKMEWYGIKKILNYYKIESLEPNEETLGYLQSKYPDMANTPIADNWEESIHDLLEMASRPDGTVEYNDMIYLGKKCLSKPRFTLGFVDESQDMSRTSYQLVTRMCEHVMMCGDKNQAIDAWRGASEEMYQHIASKADAILPLKVTQRCPPHICELANMIRPGGILQGPNTLQGANEQVPLASLPEKLRGGAIHPLNTLFVSRTNAFIIGTALFLRKHSIPCQIIDKDLSDELIKFISMFSVSSLSALTSKLADYVKRNDKARNPLWSYICRERANSISSFIAESASYSELLAKIKDIVTPQKGGFKLTTVHKAKGMEADNIFVINPPVEIKEAMSHPIAREQEINIHFVAVTRSAHNIYWVK